jgi:tetratricopeptide (TPR) repeat protein
VIDAFPGGNLNESMESRPHLFTLPPVSPAMVRLADEGSRGHTTSVLARAERLAGEHQYGDALMELGNVHVSAVSAPDLALRTLRCEGWSRLYLGELDAAAAAFERARAIAEAPIFTDVERAESVFCLGAVRFVLGKTSNAISLLSVAVALAENGGLAGERVRASALEWRARCFVVQREWEAAQADAERTLEIAESLGDVRLIALATMQCSVIAERRGNPRLALFYAEQALQLAAEGGDRRAEARLLNNIGGLKFLLGSPESAVKFMKQSFALSLETGNLTDAAQAVSSLAQVHLRCGAPILAEEQARHALTVLAGRDDYVDERGNVHLVLGRALMEQGRADEAIAALATAESLFERLGSTSQLATVWLVQGDVRRDGGDIDAAATLYRRAAEALQDFNF